MYIDKALLSESMEELEKISAGYKLPAWEQLPDIELYMDQVLSIIDRYLSMYLTGAGEEKYLTASMVNNYVKLSIIPPPNKKRYSRAHLAYLIIVCTLKQTLAMSTIQRIIPADTDEAHVKEIYDSFVKNQKKAFCYVTENIRTVADPILEREGDNQVRLNDLLMQVASSANIFKILTEKITQVTEIEQENAG